MTRVALILLLVTACTCREQRVEARDDIEPTPQPPSASTSMASPSIVAPPGLRMRDRLPETARMPSDAPPAVQRLAEACDDRRLLECWLLGRAWELGDGLTASPDHARRLYRRACREGHTGCADAARLQPDLAARYLADGCEAGDRRACAAWEGPDVDDALRCRAGVASACTEPFDGCEGTLADCLDGASLARDNGETDEAQRLARLTCSDDRRLGCVLYGELLEGRDPDAAAIAFQWACRAGDPEGCERAAAAAEGPARVQWERRAAALR